MNSIHQVDDLVKEYLLFRGFLNTFRSFEQESRSDKDKGFQADKIIEELYSYITSGDINGLLDYWKYLDLRYFSRLDARFFGSVKKFEGCLLKYYLIYAMQQKKKEKVFEFFEIFGTELSGNSEWSKWFGLPFSKNPAADPNFETFFTKQWLDTFTISLHNFLNTIFQNMPLPRLLCFDLDRIQRKALQNEIESLQNIIEDLKTRIVNGDTEISSLKQKVAQAGYSRRRLSSSNTHDRNEKDSGKHEIGSDHNGIKSSEIFSDDRSMTSISEYEIDGQIYPFTITSQEIFLENSSGITVAKFSQQGNLVASCDMDNTIRIWSYVGLSSTLKISDPNSNILSLEWEARSDKLLLYGTDERLVKVYNKEAKSIIHEFQMDDRFPRVNQISCSPVESLFACSGLPRSMDDAFNGSATGSLITWNLKTMTIQDTFTLEAPSDSPPSSIETIKFNHNGQMLVTGDKSGCVRIFDTRSLKPIMDWNIVTPGNTIKSGSGVICSSQFSFDENSIYVVDESGELSQWSIHKPGSSISRSQLQGFPPTTPTTLTNVAPTSTKSLRKRAPSASSIRSTVSTRSTSSMPAITLNTETITPFTPTSRVPMVAFSGDTEFLVCVGGTQGVIYQTSTGEQVKSLAPHKQYLTAVDWASAAENAILTGAVDGTVRVTRMIPTLNE